MSIFYEYENHDHESHDHESHDKKTLTKPLHPLSVLLASVCLMGPTGIQVAYADQQGGESWFQHSPRESGWSSQSMRSRHFERETIAQQRHVPERHIPDNQITPEFINEFMNVLSDVMAQLPSPSMQPGSSGPILGPVYGTNFGPAPMGPMPGAGSCLAPSAQCMGFGSNMLTPPGPGFMPGPMFDPLMMPNDGSRVLMGTISETAVGRSQNVDLSGQIMMLSDRDQTEIFVYATGLAAGTYSTHVHNLPCSLGGGGHYKLDPTVSEVMETNEIWPTLEVDEAGVGRGYAHVYAAARTSAQSVVVHGANGERIACGDFEDRRQGAVFSGTFSPVVPSDAGQMCDDTALISGTAQLSRLGDSAVLQLSVSGLQPNTMYPAHVHEYRCEFNAGGGHYQHDPFADNLQGEDRVYNEIWPTVVSNAEGYSAVSLSIDHSVRGDAQSVVLHAPSGEKLVCANLDGAVPAVSVATGQVLMTPMGLERGYALRGQALMMRTPHDGSTLLFKGTGFSSGSGFYTTYVGDERCALGGGNPISLRDYGNQWSPIQMNLRNQGQYVDGGAGTMAGLRVLPNFLAGPEAQSLLIYDMGDSAPIACVDFVTQ